MNITEREVLSWIAAPLISGLKDKTILEIQQILNSKNLTIERIQGLAQRAHILSLCVLRACLKDAAIPPGFARDLPIRFYCHIAYPYAIQNQWDAPTLDQHLQDWKHETEVLQQHGPFLNFLAMPKDVVLNILMSIGQNVKQSDIAAFFYKKAQDVLGQASIFPKLLAQYNLLLGGISSLFSDGLERCGLSSFCRNIPGENSTAVAKLIWEYRSILGVDQAESTTILRVDLVNLHEQYGNKSELEIAAIILPDSESSLIVPTVTAGSGSQAVLPALKTDSEISARSLSAIRATPTSGSELQQVAAKANGHPLNPNLDEDSVLGQLAVDPNSESMAVEEVSNPDLPVLSIPFANSKITPKIGRYQILEIIASGGMGTIYKGRDPQNNTIVAIKKMQNPEESSEQDLLRFQKEAKLAATLNHPSIVKITDSGLDQKVPYLVMEYVPGISLSKLLQKEKLSIRKVLEIIRHVLLGLAYAHSKGIIHRDIKPSNLMIMPDCSARIMDFGLAKNIFAKEQQITKIGQVLGTPQYMSPEQARGRVNELDGRTDIYSTGVVLYEMLTGTTPIQGVTPVDILYNVIAQEPVPIRELTPDIPKSLAAIAHKAMAKEREYRYPTAQAMLDDIDRYLQAKPVLALRTYNHWYYLKRWWHTHPKTALPILMAMISVFICAITILVMLCLR